MEPDRTKKHLQIGKYNLDICDAHGHDYRINDLWKVIIYADGTLHVGFTQNSTSWHPEQRGKETIILPIVFTDLLEIEKFIDIIKASVKIEALKAIDKT